LFHLGIELACAIESNGYGSGDDSMNQEFETFVMVVVMSIDVLYNYSHVSMRVSLRLERAASVCVKGHTDNSAKRRGGCPFLKSDEWVQHINEMEKINLKSLCGSLGRSWYRGIALVGHGDDIDDVTVVLGCDVRRAQLSQCLLRVHHSSLLSSLSQLSECPQPRKFRQSTRNGPSHTP
jgi:hypothetical protein